MLQCDEAFSMHGSNISDQGRWLALASASGLRVFHMGTFIVMAVTVMLMASKKIVDSVGVEEGGSGGVKESSGSQAVAYAISLASSTISMAGVTISFYQHPIFSHYARTQAIIQWMYCTMQCNGW